MFNFNNSKLILNLYNANTIKKFLQWCVESRNKFAGFFFISFVKMTLSNSFLASISRISQQKCLTMRGKLK